MKNCSLVITLLFAAPVLLQACAARRPLKVFILAGQSNMEGQANRTCRL